MGGEAAATKSVSSPASASCSLTTHTQTHAHGFTGGGLHPDNKDAQGGLTAARTASHITSIQCQGQAHSTPSAHLLGIKASVRLEVTVTEALIARVGKSDQLFFFTG